MRLVNLTPHVVTIRGLNGETVVEPSRDQARVMTLVDAPGEFIMVEGNAIPVARLMLGDIIGLPDPEPGVLYLVSTVTAMRVRGVRNDVVAPGDLIRDDRGRPLACLGLSRIVVEENVR